MRERTITISGASKTFSVTGWRIGTIVAPAQATDAIRKVHDFLTVGAPAPLQEGVAVAIETLGRDYYDGLARDYRARRDLLVRRPRRGRVPLHPPGGAYYILADFSGLSDLPDDQLRRLAHGRARGRPGAGLELLQSARAGTDRRAVRVLQDDGDAGGGGEAAEDGEGRVEGGRGRWRSDNRNSGRPAYIHYVC